MLNHPLHIPALPDLFNHRRVRSLCRIKADTPMVALLKEFLNIIVKFVAHLFPRYGKM